MSKRLAICTVLAIGMSVLPGAQVANAAGSSSSTGVASGDFNGDGRDDLAIGVPGEDVGPEGSEIGNAGAVNLIYGADNRLEPTDNQLWHLNQPGTAGMAEPDDQYGYALGAGDFNNDGRDDLAVGVPGRNVGPAEEAGAVHVLYGTNNGLSAAGDKIWTQNSDGILNTAQDFDQFGSALAAGNLGRSPHDDLVIGVPDESPGVLQAGMVHALYGSNNGLTSQDDQVWHQNVKGVEGVATGDENFGFSLAIADFGRSGHKDLAVGVKDDTAGASNDVLATGAVNVLYGSPDGLRAKRDQRWTQDSAEINGTAEEDDGFGWALTAADMGRSGHADLAVGAPFEDVGPEGDEVNNAGSVNVIFGSNKGLRAKYDQLWTQDSDDISDDPEEFDNFGNALSAANFGNGPTADLAVGVTLEDLPTNNEGLVHLIYGTPQGLKFDGSQLWSEDSDDVEGIAEENDIFGVSLVPGDFGGSSLKDLAIGASGEESAAGAVHVLLARNSGLAANGDQVWSQDSPQIKDIAEDDDRFGLGRVD